jgi:hypothetical protein
MCIAHTGTRIHTLVYRVAAGLCAVWSCDEVLIGIIATAVGIKAAIEEYGIIVHRAVTAQSGALAHTPAVVRPSAVPSCYVACPVSCALGVVASRPWSAITSYAGVAVI